MEVSEARILALMDRMDARKIGRGSEMVCDVQGRPYPRRETWPSSSALSTLRKKTTLLFFLNEAIRWWVDFVRGLGCSWALALG
jgi:hypothetical protein